MEPSLPLRYHIGGLLEVEECLVIFFVGLETIDFVNYPFDFQIIIAKFRTISVLAVRHFWLVCKKKIKSTYRHIFCLISAYNKFRQRFLSNYYYRNNWFELQQILIFFLPFPLFLPFQTPNGLCTCQLCGGYRLLPCPSCNGSKKSVHRNHFTTDFVALKCMNCDENGLVQCYNCD